MPSNLNLDYYYGNEAEQYSFYRIPKALLTDPRYKSVSIEAKVLYGLLLDRMGLSVKNGWMDSNQRVYIYFTQEDATVNRWLNGISTPNVYQFREIAYFFGLPYEWFTEDEGNIPNVDDLALKLGLSLETVRTLLELVSEGGNEATLEAVDNALCAALAVIDGVFEDLDRYADRVIAEVEGMRNDKE